MLVLGITLLVIAFLSAIGACVCFHLAGHVKEKRAERALSLGLVLLAVMVVVGEAGIFTTWSATKPPVQHRTIAPRHSGAISSFFI